MLQNATSKKSKHSVPSSAGAQPALAATNPPPVVVATPEPHLVYGIFPAGACSLEELSIDTLNKFHKKACALLEPWNTPGKMSDDEDRHYQAIHQCQWDIFNAASRIELASGRQIATFFELWMRHQSSFEGEGDNYVVSVNILKRIASALQKATEYPRPTKRIGSLNKGKKLTRAGLMVRYHAFLIGELNTLGISFYGSREYPEKMIPIDSAVTARTSNFYKEGKPVAGRRRTKLYPFFDESKLTDRARSVLNSLKIDTINAEPR